MPNWCNNSLSVSHEDPAMMAKFAEGVREGNLFATFLPMPTELDGTVSPSEPNAALVEKYGASDWYTWNCDNWGTKWDVSAGEFELDEDNKSGSGWFETAWSPPLAAYYKLQEIGFKIDAFYSEPGMGFCGTWVEGEEEYIDNFYDLFADENWAENVDVNSDIKYFLEDEYNCWLEYRREEEEAAERETKQ